MIPGLTQQSFITHLEVALGRDHTEEQKELIRSFGDGPLFCFADPGTGKTFTAVSGLINAELFKQIPGNQIYALSFTRMATGELAVRHEEAVRKLAAVPNVHFSTLHKLCLGILSENYSLLGMNSFGNSGGLTLERSVSIIEKSLQDWNLETSLDPRTIKSIIRACESLNAALIFDEDNVRSKAAFKSCGVEYDIFNKARGALFGYSLLSENIAVSDILLYTLMLMQKHPEVSEKFKSQCKLMLVDEAQDLSLLHLRVISYLTDCPIFIGDMKQQIYAFNGACQEIVEQFFKRYPNAKTCKLTQSFRCMSEIADFATQIIIPNKIGGEDFKGVSEGGDVSIHCGYGADGLDLETMVRKIKSEFVTNMNVFKESILFLFRNNASVIPIAEELYKQQLPFRVNKYTEAYAIPVMKEACEILALCANPKTPSNIAALQYIIPEFRSYSNIMYNPLYKICTQKGCSVFEVNYQFKDPSAKETMNLLMEIREMILAKASVKDLINTLWPVFNHEYLARNSWKYDNDVQYYLGTVEPLVHKDYTTFVQDELEKVKIIKDCNRYNRGIRCYTMHASKGLEADIVYIIDADKGIIPNDKKLDRLVKQHCDLDAARNVREERALCYVACTRAKKELHIVYKTRLAPMFVGENEYKMYDDVYMFNGGMSDDIAAFEDFVVEHINPWIS